MNIYEMQGNNELYAWYDNLTWMRSTSV